MRSFGPLVPIAAVGALLTVALAVSEAPRPAEAATTPCTGTLSAGTYQDVSVPSGAICTLTAGVTVRHDVTVQPGGSLIDRGARVDHDIVARRPIGIAIDGAGPGMPGYVGHDIVINGLSGGSTYLAKSSDNLICNTTVGHDVVVTFSAQTAYPIEIGNTFNCAGGGLTIGHDLTADNNATVVSVDGNTVNHDLTVNRNGPVNVESNTVRVDLTVNGNQDAVVLYNSAGHDATCRFNGGLMGASNTAGGTNTCGT